MPTLTLRADVILEVFAAALLVGALVLLVVLKRMLTKLNESYQDLKVAHEKLSGINKNYLDLISFVSHELKAILASTVLNAYSVRDGFLGLVNFKQQKALDSITRNLDYLAATVKNFLSLSRIEKGEMTVVKSGVLLKEELFDDALDNFAKQIANKEIEVVNSIKPGVRVFGDRDLLLVAVNNLVGNAVKYGVLHGRIMIHMEDLPANRIKITVYNDGRPITAGEKEKLFKKFSRLDAPEVRREKGTGLGLFIAREIIEGHGGRICVEPSEKGNSFFFEIEKGG